MSSIVRAPAVASEDVDVEAADASVLVVDVLEVEELGSELVEGPFWPQPESATAMKEETSKTRIFMGDAECVAKRATCKSEATIARRHDTRTAPSYAFAE